MKKLYGFLMMLGFSRMRYIEFVTDMSTSTLPGLCIPPAKRVVMILFPYADYDPKWS